MIPFLSSPLIFASVRKNSSEDVNTNVSVPSLFSYCPKEPLNYGIHCTGVSLFSVLESDSENQVEISGLLREKASLKFKDHKLSMYRVHSCILDVIYTRKYLWPDLLGKHGICVLLELGFACNNYQPRIQFRFVLT